MTMGLQVTLRERTFSFRWCGKSETDWVCMKCGTIAVDGGCPHCASVERKKKERLQEFLERKRNEGSL